MSELTANKNFLSPLGFRFVLQRAPNLEFFCQEFTLPEISIEDVTQESPNLRLYYPGTKMEYAPLNVEFIVDENLSNYKEIQEWLFGLGAPQKSEQFANLNRQEVIGEPGGLRSDGTLIVLTSNHNANIEIVFRNLFPISLSPLNFTTTSSDVDYIKATATFRYNAFTFVGS